MHDRKLHESDVIGLGKASVETRGQAIFDVDLSTGPSRYAPGLMAE